MVARATGDIGSVVKAVELLTLLGDHGSELGVNEASRRLLLHKSTVSRLLTTLARRGLVARNARTGAFGLGPGLIRLAGAALHGMDLRSRARPVLERLAEETRETIFLSILDGGLALEIDEVAGSHAIPRSRVDRAAHPAPLHRCRDDADRAFASGGTTRAGRTASQALYAGNGVRVGTARRAVGRSAGPWLCGLAGGVRGRAGWRRSAGPRPGWQRRRSTRDLRARVSPPGSAGREPRSVGGGGGP